MVVKINDKDVKFSFGLYFLGKAQINFNVDLSGLLQMLIKNPTANMVDLMWYSAVCESELDEVELPIKKRDFVDFLEGTNDFKNTDGVLAKYSNALLETIRGNFLPVNDEPVKEGEGEKKN